MTAIRCHFVRVGERFVHYRRAGTGPAVILLHQTPQSSKSMEPLMRRLQSRATVIALDTPGFGLSDRLSGELWTMDQLVMGLSDTLDALGIGRAAFAGQHTGGSIAVEFARRYPERTACVAADGYTVFTREEAERILPHQLYRFRPSWDGSHLVWAWARFRDGWMFFPWSDRKLAARRDTDLPSPERIQNWQIMELLRSGNSHLAVYPPIFAWDGLAAAQVLRVPAMLVDTEDDQLYPHLDRLRELPANVAVARFGNGAREELEAAIAGFLLRHLDGPAVSPVIPSVTPNASGTLRTCAAGMTAEARVAGHGEPTLILHGAGERAAVALERATGTADGPIYAIDLPGHGESGGAVLAPAAAAEVMAAALKELGLAKVRVVGRNLGATVGVELARLAPERVTSLDLADLPELDPVTRAHWIANYAPPIELRPDGTHLVTLWNQIRDRELFTPWFETKRANIRRIEPDLDPERLTQKLFAALLCTDWPRAHRVWFEWDTKGLADVRYPICRPD